MPEGEGTYGDQVGRPKKKKKKLKFLSKEWRKARKKRRNYRSKTVQYGSSSDMGDTPQKDVYYKTKGSDKKQQAKVATTDGEGKVKHEAVSEKTKGGEYKVYGKESKKAQSFRDAFAEASKAGKSTFMWNGLKYSTKKA